MLLVYVCIEYILKALGHPCINKKIYSMLKFNLDIGHRFQKLAKLSHEFEDSEIDSELMI